MERMRKEMVELLSKYVEMDKDALELNLEQDGEQIALMLSIPVIRAKDEEEIKAALGAEDNKTEEESDETSEQEDETSEETVEESDNSSDDADYVDDDEEEIDDDIEKDDEE